MEDQQQLSDGLPDAETGHGRKRVWYRMPASNQLAAPAQGQRGPLTARPGSDGGSRSAAPLESPISQERRKERESPTLASLPTPPCNEAQPGPSEAVFPGKLVFRIISC